MKISEKRESATAASLVFEAPEARHHIMLDQPLGFVAALRMLLDCWMRNESAGESS